MANHKSAIKRHKQSLKRRDANRASKAEVRTALKKASSITASGKKAEALTATRQAESLMAKAVKKGRFHKKTLARKISRLAKQAHKAAK